MCVVFDPYIHVFYSDDIYEKKIEPKLRNILTAKMLKCFSNEQSRELDCMRRVCPTVTKSDFYTFHKMLMNAVPF